MSLFKNIDRRFRKTKKDSFGNRSRYWYARNVVRNVFNDLKTAELAKVNFRSPIIMGFIPRSGSTWVTQMSNLDRVVCISDPLLERNAWLASRKYNFKLREQYLSEAEICETKDFLNDCFTCKARFTSATTPKKINLDQSYTPFVKMANANWCLPYLSKTFNAFAFQLVRHPISTALSQLNHWNMPFYLDKTIDRLLLNGHIDKDQYGRLLSIIDSSDQFSIRLAQTCIETEFSLSRLPGLGVPCAKYENLRDGSLYELSFLEKVDENWEDKLRRSFHIPSKTTQSTSTIGKAKYFEKAHIDIYKELTSSLRLTHTMENYN